MTVGVQKSMAWSGAAFVALVFAGFLMVGLIPPISPTSTADQVVQFWSTNTGLKRFGLVIMLAAAGLQAPFGALVAVRLKYLEGRYSPLTYLQIVATGLAVMAIIMPVFFFAAASYRPTERAPQITQALNDLGWLPFVMNWPAATIQCLAIGFAIFGYQGARPLFPRWVAYFNFWCAFLFAAGGLVVLFKTGVFAWNGLLAFWIVAVFFGTYFLVMTWQLLVSIPKHDLTEVDGATAAPTQTLPA